MRLRRGRGLLYPKEESIMLQKILRWIAVVVLVLLPACGSQPGDEEFKIGLVTDLGRVNDRGFNQSAWEGVMMAGTGLDAHVEYVETQSEADYEKNVRRFADDGYDVIVTVGYALGNVTTRMADAYPDVDFIGIDQYQIAPRNNVTGLIFHEDRAGYLAGALAAHISENGTIAAVLGTDEVPPVGAFKEGYEAGARAVDPEIEVIATYHPGEIAVAFDDPEWGSERAEEAIAQGADVIFGAGGMTGNGALQAAASAGDVYCIGVDTDQWETVPGARPCLVSSAMKFIFAGVGDLVLMAYEGELPRGNYYGEVGLAPFHDFEEEIPVDVRMDLARIGLGLENGEISTGYGD